MNKTILQDNETQSIELEQAIIPTAIDWSEPILFEEIAPPSIPTNLLPDWLGNFAEAVSKSSQTPPEMSIMFALSVLSTCLQGKVEVSPTGGDYFEPVNIWTLTALPPSSRKSAVVKMMIEPLMQWEKEQAAKLQPLIDEQETTKVINQKRANELQVQASKEADVDARKLITKEIATLKAASSDDVIIPQLFTGDITAEELQNLLVRQNEKMSVLADEGGIFEVMTGLYNDGKVNIDVFLQAYSGSAVRVNRGQRTVSLSKPALSFGLTVQPEIISSLCQGNKRKLRGIGALARFLYAVPKSNIGTRDVRKNQSVPESIKSVYSHNIKLLLDLKPEQPVRLVLSTPALDAWHDFAQDIENKQGEGGEYQSIQDWTGKLPGTALRIAALSHVAKHWLTAQDIAVEDMKAAINLCTLLIVHARSAFESMALDTSIEDAKYTLSWLLKQPNDHFSKRTLHRDSRFSRTKIERVNCALLVLEERGIISPPVQLPTSTKPVMVHFINPAIQNSIA